MFMKSFGHELQAQLQQVRAQSLYRELRQVDSPQGPRVEIEHRRLLNFSSNDYLGLANHSDLKEAATQSIVDYGAGSGASRLICGSLAPHHDLEQALAHFKNTEAALTFSTGYAAALGTICALLDQNDIIIVDKLIHGSVIDAARLCGAKLRVFAHNDLNKLEEILKWANAKRAARLSPRRVPRILVVTESVFSMDGDLAPLREIIELKEKHGAWLMLDEAHAAGLYGANRRGLAEAYGLADRVEIQMGTLGKALGTSGGFICGSRTLIDLLVNRARSFIFSTAPVPAAAAAAAAAVRLVQSDEGEVRRTRLWQRVDQVKNMLIRLNQPLSTVQSAIIPIVIGSESDALELAHRLRAAGVLIPAIRYPTVARGRARLRLTVTAAHGGEDIAALEAALNLVFLSPPRS
jgi:8-amino-7-oxononanoate synthase